MKNDRKFSFIFKACPSIKMSFAYHSFCFLVCVRTLSVKKVLFQYFPPMFTKLASTPRKFILPTLELTHKKFIFVPHKTKKSVQKIDDGNDDEG